MRNNKSNDKKYDNFATPKKREKSPLQKESSKTKNGKYKENIIGNKNEMIFDKLYNNHKDMQ